MDQNHEFMETVDLNHLMFGPQAQSVDANQWEHGIDHLHVDVWKNGVKSESFRDSGNAVYQDAHLYSVGVEVPPDDDFDHFLSQLGQPANATDPLDTQTDSFFGYGNTAKNPEDDNAVMELVGELYRDDPGPSTHQPSHPELPPPMPNAQLTQPQSPKSSFSDEPLPVTPGRVAEIDKMAEYINTVIERSSSIRPEYTSPKLKAHEVILVILLNSAHGDKSKDLRRILAFCDENGREVSGKSWHFKTLDTETMGALWMKIKGNRNGSYDTFARAMRMRREKSAKANESGYFDYLETGLRSKKRVYRFGPRAMADVDRIKQALKVLADQQQAFGSGAY